ncbi:hypothetical protein PVAP13_3NG182540 [Panicum virgatum]|uniref:Uncharacterized protein n=1 Tax=Panicum virgatum TaxID=38727 RepID=A0A8T0U753_PANVG|nr:hypothetical protein PVAP13_3NG182540 [Panicum virgatum]
MPDHLAGWPCTRQLVLQTPPRYARSSRPAHPHETPPPAPSVARPLAHSLARPLPRSPSDTGRRAPWSPRQGRRVPGRGRGEAVARPGRDRGEAGRSMRHRPANLMALVEAKHAGVSISSAELADPLFVVVLDSVETPIRQSAGRRQRWRAGCHRGHRAPPRTSRGHGRWTPAGHRNEDARGSRGEVGRGGAAARPGRTRRGRLRAGAPPRAGLRRRERRLGRDAAGAGLAAGRPPLAGRATTAAARASQGEGHGAARSSASVGPSPAASSVLSCRRGPWPRRAPERIPTGRDPAARQAQHRRGPPLRASQGDRGKEL